MKTSLKFLLAASLLGILTACGNNTSSDNAVANSTTPVSMTGSPLGNAPTSIVQSVDAYRPPVSTQKAESPMKPRDLSNAPVPTSINLGAPLASQAAAARKNNATPSNDHMGKPLQIGFGREVAQTTTASATHQVLKWQATAVGGQVAAINFSSTGAKGIRIGLLITQLPASATLRFYAKGDATAFEVKGAEVLAVVAKNVASGDTSNDARTYWSPVLKTNNGTVEIEIPAGVDANDIRVSVPIITHLFMSMSEAQTISAQAIYSGGSNLGLSCQVDVKCTSPLPAASDAVAWLVFNQSAGGANICSGTLLNDNQNSGTPYILTANHCISTQTFASTLYTEFKFRSLTCNVDTSGEYFVTATTGAALLYTAYNTDSTLLRLNGAPSTPVLFAGWDATIAPTVGTLIHSIHHPRGDQQRLSRGTVSGYAVRNPTNPNLFGNSSVAASTILNVTLTTGLTEGGSSGSALLKGTDANPQVIGQLFGGSFPACGVNATNVYGRFDVAFKAGMSTWLSPTAPAPNPNRQPVYRFFNTQLNTYFYTIYATERDAILATLSNVLVYEGVAFYTSPTAATGFSPVYRFRNNINGAYLYTISLAEYNSIVQNYPQFVYEGIAWYAEPTNANGGLPLYRFLTATSHIYTAYESERLAILANYPSFIFEGISYFIRQTP